MPAKLTETIPDYLLPHIVDQDASLYTPIDHASWRFILKLSQAFFATHAHQKYLDGLRETGISTDRIPLISEMDTCLRRFGWRAVAVSGFIPPAVFMEFLSLGILPIACDMRKIENLAYTPAPDIVHEAAGHAPIIADPEYAAYLRSYGEISKKAIFSSQDMEVYLAIRNLSDVKEDPASTEAQISAAQARLDEAVAQVDYVSEATELARMSWWTIEYGLVGSMKEPKIYGAGLLSSLGESYHCLDREVRHVPFDLSCIEVSYDITRPQPQLFVASDFQVLTRVLDELAATMAFRLGGVKALDRAIQAKTVTCTELDSGVQVSGVLASYLQDSQGNPSFVRYQGPCQIAYQDRELEGQGPAYHREGFSTPIGKIRGLGKSAAQLSEQDFKSLGFLEDQPGLLAFESGIEVVGILKHVTRRDGRNLILTFRDCTVRQGDQTLYDPSWGPFDLACGESIPSVFGNAADRKHFWEATGMNTRSTQRQKSNLTPENRELNQLYAQVRELRSNARADWSLLDRIHDQLESRYPEDWLLRYELLELNTKHRLQAPWVDTIQRRLKSISAADGTKAEMIARGLALL